MMVNGKMINNMEKEKKHGLMEVLMKESILMAKDKDLVILNGLMVLNMKVIFLKICFMEKDNILGMIKENILVNGNIIK